MTGRTLTVGTLFLMLVLSAGCVWPVTGRAEYGGPSAMQQLAIANAARDALKKPKLDALHGMKVWVDVAVVSSAGAAGAGSEDAHFLKNMIIETLVESGVRVVEKGEAEAALRGVCQAMGTDSVSRVFPHAWLPLLYYVSHTARVKIHLYAYDVKDSQPIAVDDCEGTYSWSEWSAFGLGPFR